MKNRRCWCCNLNWFMNQSRFGRMRWILRSWPLSWVLFEALSHVGTPVHQWRAAPVSNAPVLWGESWLRGGCVRLKGKGNEQSGGGKNTHNKWRVPPLRICLSTAAPPTLPALVLPCREDVILAVFRGGWCAWRGNVTFSGGATAWRHRDRVWSRNMRHRSSAGRTKASDLRRIRRPTAGWRDFFKDFVIAPRFSRSLDDPPQSRHPDSPPTPDASQLIMKLM